MSDMIYTMIKEPGKDIRQQFIHNTLEELQTIVGGYIEIVHPLEGVAMVVNEEGKLFGLEDNFKCGLDTIVGTAVFLGEKDGELTDLELGDAALIMTLMQEWQKLSTRSEWLVKKDTERDIYIVFQMRDAAAGYRASNVCIWSWYDNIDEACEMARALNGHD